MSRGGELVFKTKKTSEKISENIHIFANDPSLAFFRVQEHVRKVSPAIFEKRDEVFQLQNNLQGHCYDMEYGIQALRTIEKSESVFDNIQEMIKASIFLKQQLRYEENRKKVKKESTKSSVYKRFSAHLALDLPELPDFGGVMRETSQRMENMIGPAAGTSRTEAGSSTSQAPPQPSNPGELQRSYTTLH